MLSPYEAREILRACRIDIPEDYHRLPSIKISGLLAAADQHKYRAPRSANGSRARYFHDYLQRRAASRK